MKPNKYFLNGWKGFILIANFGLLINILGGLFLVVSGVLWVI